MTGHPDAGLSNAPAGADPAELIVERLHQTPQGSLFATELASALSRAGHPCDALERALSALTAARAIVVVDHPAPDRHLNEIDRRTVALIAGSSRPAGVSALSAAQDLWNAWLRTFLATHRCS